MSAVCSLQDDVANAIKVSTNVIRLSGRSRSVVQQRLAEWDDDGRRFGMRGVVCMNSTSQRSVCSETIVVNLR
ncbi:hypothetical protein EG68_10634 [Paragonimus skrjabini miyazakii]|uniref:Uncharacterized protein n=1 Tax=Paragonimus skrjabini miyazakii TaxID=59628 RepID=A0A8S9YNH5_9TREM|nr:hypothetical protein EG68_10634 [Paragonimus skrjabini miyazakii]